MEFITKIKYFVGKNITFSQWKNRSILRDFLPKLLENRSEEVGVDSGQVRILDLGSGNGEYSLALAKVALKKGIGVSIVALDSSDSNCKLLMEECEKKEIKNIETVKGDAHKLDFADESFDACFCNTVLEHVKGPEKVVSEVYRVLKSGGKVLFSIPFLQEIHADPYDFQRYTPYGLREILERQGFEVMLNKNDFGAVRSIEYLLFGSIVWRMRLGFWKNFPLGYVYVLFLFLMFLFAKLGSLLFAFVQKDDLHFMTQVTMLARKAK